jgi:hypothetical protein
VNQKLEIYLRFYVNNTHTDWSTLLSLTEFAYNDKAHSTTKISPHFTLFGIHLWKGNPMAILDAKNPTGTDLGKRIENIRLNAHAALKKSQELANRHMHR